MATFRAHVAAVMLTEVIGVCLRLRVCRVHVVCCLQCRRPHCRLATARPLQCCLLRVVHCMSSVARCPDASVHFVPLVVSDARYA
jgi:hypothetical protein